MHGSRNTRWGTAVQVSKSLFAGLFWNPKALHNRVHETEHFQCWNWVIIMGTTWHLSALVKQLITSPCRPRFRKKTKSLRPEAITENESIHANPTKSAHGTKTAWPSSRRRQLSAASPPNSGSLWRAPDPVTRASLLVTGALLLASSYRSY